MDKQIKLFYSFYKEFYKNNKKAINFMNDAIEKYGEEKAILLLSKSATIKPSISVPNEIKYPDILPPGASAGVLTRDYSSLSSGGTIGTTNSGFSIYCSTQNIAVNNGKFCDIIYLSFEITSNYFSNVPAQAAFYIGISKGTIPNYVAVGLSSILSQLNSSKPFIFFNYWGNYYYNTTTPTGLISSVNVSTNYPTNPFRIYIKLNRSTGIFSIGMSKTNLVDISPPAGNVFNWTNEAFFHFHAYSQSTNVLSPQTYTLTMIDW